VGPHPTHQGQTVAKSKRYQRHEPEATPLYKIVAEHLETFLREAREKHEQRATRSPTPPPKAETRRGVARDHSQQTLRFIESDHGVRWAAAFAAARRSLAELGADGAAAGAGDGAGYGVAGGVGEGDGLAGDGGAEVPVAEGLRGGVAAGDCFGDGEGDVLEVDLAAVAVVESGHDIAGDRAGDGFPGDARDVSRGAALAEAERARGGQAQIDVRG
jgi:hypothetical protein